jgi:hypothetical protein
MLQMVHWLTGYGRTRFVSLVLLYRSNVQQRSINCRTVQCCVPKYLWPRIILHMTAMPYSTGILHWSLTNTFLPTIPACVHTAITVPEVVMCHCPDTTPCCIVCLYFELAVAQLVEALRYKPVARSIPDGVIRIFSRYNPSGHTMALG